MHAMLLGGLDVALGDSKVMAQQMMGWLTKQAVMIDSRAPPQRSNTDGPSRRAMAPRHSASVTRTLGSGSCEGSRHHVLACRSCMRGCFCLPAAGTTRNKQRDAADGNAQQVPVDNSLQACVVHQLS